MGDIEIDDIGLELYVRRIVLFILNNSASKLPIKRTDITTHCVNGKVKLLVRTFPLAVEKLLEVYGIKVLEVTNASQKQYICVSTEPSASLLEYNESQKREMTLLFIILTFLFMKDSSVSEEGLFQFLLKFKISVDDPHPFFGDNIKKLITETFVKQLYLKKEKVVLEGRNDESILYSWGFRSKNEFPKKDVLEEVAEILGKPSMCFVKQHREVYGDNATETMDLTIS